MKILLFLLISGLIFTSMNQTDFLTEQKKYERVRAAIREKGSSIALKLRKSGKHIKNINVLFIAYKTEKILELYVKEKEETAYELLETYPICASSGKLGPKLQQGDNQVPEGFYFIEKFNPSSNYYLSLGLNYPNSADRIKSNATDLGGDIYIHGSCVTIGCLPMTDDKIKEIYLFSVYAKNCGQNKIPVYIYPFKMTDINMKIYNEKYKNNKTLLEFWSNLNKGYAKFESKYQQLGISVDSKGNYLF